MYHIHKLTLRQAQVLWSAGFREVDELDGEGLTPLMVRDCPTAYELSNYWELVAWLVKKGADLLRRQNKSLYKPTTKNIHHPSRNGRGQVIKLNKASSTTATHYLANQMGDFASRHDFRVEKEGIGLYLGEVEAFSEQARCLHRQVLSNALPDCCNCACSTAGCMPYTMMVKYPVTKARRYSYYSNIEVRKAILQMSQALAQYLDIDQPSLAWLRREMIRFNTFERLELRHTCCEMDYFYDRDYANEVIYEPYDDEEIHEINNEQAEQLERLESLLIEFQTEYDKSASTFCEFLEGYWTDRMNEVTSEKGPIDDEALRDMGIVMRKTSRTSSQSSGDPVEEVE